MLCSKHFYWDRPCLNLPASIPIREILNSPAKYLEQKWQEDGGNSIRHRHNFQQGLMKKKPRKQVIPPIVQETTRHAIIALLGGEALSAQDISKAVHIPEKEVFGHLEHIRQSLHATGSVLEINPAECRMCGFVFVKRDRMTPPGKCPVCRSEAVFDPLFSILD